MGIRIASARRQAVNTNLRTRHDWCEGRGRCSATVFLRVRGGPQSVSLMRVNMAEEYTWATEGQYPQRRGFILKRRCCEQSIDT
jgi:hypothetical protein